MTVEALDSPIYRKPSWKSWQGMGTEMFDTTSYR